MTRRIAILIDGGHLRVAARQAKQPFGADLIEKVAHACATATEEIQRILYYDCPQYGGHQRLPVSGVVKEFRGGDRLLTELARKDLIAVRRGELKFRGWEPKTTPLPSAALSDDHFKPRFEQKGVDMRIGLDMANYAVNRSVDALALCSNDTDCIPAMKYARRAGLQVVLACLPDCKPAIGLAAHSDFTRQIAWPLP